MLRLSTDYHIGKMASSHTTKNSKLRLANAIYANALEANNVSDDCIKLCLGDLFDRYSNSEMTLLQGWHVATQLDFILGGNHDMSNREDVISSLNLIATMGKPSSGSAFKTVAVGVNECGYHTVCKDRHVLVPHHSTQQMFESTLKALVQEGCKYDLVMLHCNYDNAMAQADSSLNLTPELAEEVLTVCNRIVLGHEHQHRTELGGKVLILGNTHPTSFSDIGNKYYWDYAEESGEFSKTLVWDAKKHYVRLPVDHLLSGAFVLTDDIQFIEVVGEEVAPAKSPAVTAAIAKLWDEVGETVFMIRNNVQYQHTSIERAEGTDVKLESVADAIKADLDGGDLLDLFTEALESFS